MLVFILTSYASQAQKDSVWQNLTRPLINQVNKSEATISTYTTRADSIIQTVQDIPLRYIKQVDQKISTYSSRITGKTEKTLAKLSKWENKIRSMLEKVSPETAQKLFANEELTFSGMLKKYNEGKAAVGNYKTQYNEYRDKLTTNIKYLSTQKNSLDAKFVKPLSEVTKKADKLEDDVANTEAVEKFIKQRKKQLIDEAVKYIGKSKYLKKINKESYYYVETLRNYKEIFSDSKKAEETAKTILNKIPAFKKFMQQNSELASLFGGASGISVAPNLAGLQTRVSVNSMIQGRISSGGPNASQLVSQSIQQAQAEISKLKDKVLKAGGGNSNTEIPDFKPNKQKSKTFLQRIEYGFDYQFAKNNSLMPTTADIGLHVGYKLNDKSLLGIGASYKLGIGSIEKIRFSHQGLGLRSFIDWKLKKQFYISGGFEMNYNAAFKNITQLRKYNEWQQSGLIGISKKINLKSKFTKGTKLQLLYDFLARQHVPVSQPILFRIGYSLN